MPAEVSLQRLWSGSQWVRRRYYVEGGSIRPITGSAVEVYDPFAAYYGADSPTQGRSLYLEMVALDEQDDAAIEAFASRRGLLGLFYDPLLQVEWTRVGPGDEKLPVDRPVGTTRFQSPIAALLCYDLPPPWLEGVERSEWQATALVRQPGGISYTEQPLETYSQPFFPGLSETLPSPSSLGAQRGVASRLLSILHSPARWDWLAEPVNLFREAVIEFREAYEACQHWEKQDPLDIFVEHLADLLARHIHHVHPVPHYRPVAGQAPDATPGALGRAPGPPGQWKLGWFFPSLLAAAYTMLLQDFTGNRNLRFCANETCGKPFVTDRSDQRYCSPPCGNQQKQRQLRRRRR